MPNGPKSSFASGVYEDSHGLKRFKGLPTLAKSQIIGSTSGRFNIIYVYLPTPMVKYIYVQPRLRIYPLGFGEALRTAMKDWRAQPTLRQKLPVPVDRTDVEIFRSMSLGDTWADAELPKVYRYLRQNQELKIPDTWHEAMREFDLALDAACPP